MRSADVFLSFESHLSFSPRHFQPDLCRMPQNILHSLLITWEHRVVRVIFGSVVPKALEEGCTLMSVCTKARYSMSMSVWNILLRPPGPLFFLFSEGLYNPPALLAQ